VSERVRGHKCRAEGVSECEDTCAVQWERVSARVQVTKHACNNLTLVRVDSFERQAAARTVWQVVSRAAGAAHPIVLMRITRSN
jgi:hypothetical protein